MTEYDMFDFIQNNVRLTLEDYLYDGELQKEIVLEVKRPMSSEGEGDWEQVSSVEIEVNQ